MKNKIILILSVLFSFDTVTAQSEVPEYIQAYIQLKDALYAGDVDKVKDAATIMKTKIATTNIDNKKKVDAINSLAAIASGDNIGAQRASFSKLSRSMISLLQENPVEGITLYSVYCPMALDGKGAYWLSMDKNINNNPYLGQKMAHCGSIDETISK